MSVSPYKYLSIYSSNLNRPLSSSLAFCFSLFLSLIHISYCTNTKKNCTQNTENIEASAIFKDKHSSHFPLGKTKIPSVTPSKLNLPLSRLDSLYDTLYAHTDGRVMEFCIDLVRGL